MLEFELKYSVSLLIYARFPSWQHTFLEYATDPLIYDLLSNLSNYINNI